MVNIKNTAVALSVGAAALTAGCSSNPRADELSSLSIPNGTPALLGDGIPTGDMADNSLPTLRCDEEPIPDNIGMAVTYRPTEDGRLELVSARYVEYEKKDSEGDSTDYDVRVAVELGGLTIGKRGSFSYIIDPLSGQPKSEEGFHEFEMRDGLLLGQRGTLKFIVDPETGAPVSKGYHEIGYVRGNIVGQLGAGSEVIDLKEKVTNGSN